MIRKKIMMMIIMMLASENNEDAMIDDDGLLRSKTNVPIKTFCIFVYCHLFNNFLSQKKKNNLFLFKIEKKKREPDLEI